MTLQDFAGDGRACKVNGRAQALVGPGLATPLLMVVIATIYVPYLVIVCYYIVYFAHGHAQ